MKKITIIGTGYVGLVTGAGLADFGNSVICVDIIESKIKLLKNGIIPIYEPGLKDIIKHNVKEKRLNFTTNIKKAINNSEVIFIAVGTPELETGDADLSFIEQVAKVIGENLNNYKVICTKSTVPIGTGDTICKTIKLNNNNDTSFDYVSNPEFLREGSAVKDFLWPDRVIIGASSERAFTVMKDVYRPLYVNEKPILHTNIETAEMIKYAANSFLALKISYINEIANLCEEVGADVHLVAKGMGKDGRISSKFLHPGPGFGGSCFPKDTRALVSLASNKNIELKTVKATIEVNIQQKERMFLKLKKLLNNNISNKLIAVLGIAFKPNTDDFRESSSINMIESILKEGGIVNTYDPVISDEIKKTFPIINCFNSWENCSKDTDALVIMTEWNVLRGLDLKKLAVLMKTPIILDTRNILSLDKLKKNGFIYDNVGRNNIK